MFAPYGYYRPKLGWGALGGFGEDNTPSYSPPSGWRFLLGPVLVTESNREQFSSGMPNVISDCGLSSVAVLVNDVYVPPIGWYAAIIEQADDSGDTYDVRVDTVWINPAGGSYQLTACGGGYTGGTGVGFTGLIVAAVVGGVLLWKTFKKKRGTKSRRR